MNYAIDDQCLNHTCPSQKKIAYAIQNVANHNVLASAIALAIKPALTVSAKKQDRLAKGFARDGARVDANSAKTIGRVHNSYPLLQFG
jgi:ABC-type thiamine transport system ATPase subunit